MSPPRINLTYPAPVPDFEWDDFIDQLPHGHHEQSSAWANYRATQGWDCCRMTLSAPGGIVGGLQCLTRSAPLIGRVGYVPKGPIISPGAEGHLAPLLRRLTEWARGSALAYLVVDPTFLHFDPTPDLDGCGLARHPEHFPPRALMYATMILDLTRSEGDLMEAMSPRTRYNVRHGMRQGFTFRTGSRAEVPGFFELVRSTCARRREVPTPRHADDFSRIWDSLGSRVRLFFLEDSGAPLVGGFGFVGRQVLRLWKFGWDGRLKEKHPTQAFWWNLVLWAKAQGIGMLDFVQIDAPMARAIRAGLPLTPEQISSNLHGPTTFKAGFGGEIIDLPGARIVVFHPALRLLSHLADGKGSFAVRVGKVLRRIAR